MAVSAVIVLVVALGVVVLVTSGGDEDGDDDEVAADEVEAGSDTTTADSTTTTEPSTTTEPPETNLPGEEFVDPEGVYKMHIGPEWVPNHQASLQAMELWVVAQSAGELPGSVSVVTLEQGGDLSTYMDGARQGVEVVIDGFTEVDSDIVEGAAGQELGFLEYTGSQQGVDLHGLQVYLVGDNASVAATLTTTREAFADVRSAVEPYLLTMRFEDCPTKQFTCT